MHCVVEGSGSSGATLVEADDLELSGLVGESASAVPLLVDLGWGDAHCVPVVAIVYAWDSDVVRWGSVLGRD